MLNIALIDKGRSILSFNCLDANATDQGINQSINQCAYYAPAP